ncbi:response regulator transcription factor [Leptolyngbya sp. NIES-2104]|uniref:response regulator transcription factor n=1 Tax=Leptolyngbya sp. NIES-2104 TaxID=1552121 RepID=UPI0006ECB633|nr:response regulator transcription factor [Leptolyngbya sp. NIES-2104]GAP99284.1 two-component response regulator [Leptolyngbya sp. NIES-2104]
MISTVPAQQQISVLLVDDDSKFRQGLQTLLQFYSTTQDRKFKVIGEAASTDQAIQLAEQQRPMLILLDMELANGDGITALNELVKLEHRSKILVVSGHQEEEWVFRAMRAGANGYVVKTELATELFNATTTVLNDQVYLSPDLATRFFQMFRFYNGQALDAKAKLHLTDREQEVLTWLVQGASNEEIATRLYISVATVKAHLTAIFHKLGVTSRTQAIIRALKMGLVSC